VGGCGSRDRALSGFRDRLRQSPEDRAAYERVKRDLATRAWTDVNEYAEAKGKLIESIIAKAKT
jgi:GrpB-like predicted nucleotidyltransferase (UPF0157 family)